jgi:transcriptional regulator with XRE-family HTH domain
MSTEQNPNGNPIGPVLRAIREGSGMSVRGLAKAAGISHSHLLRVESGERDVSRGLELRLLSAVADRLLRRGEAA